MPAREHSIIDSPQLWMITALAWKSGQNGTEGTLDLSLSRDGIEKTLRFIEPTGVFIEIDSAYPVSCGDMKILDVSKCQLEGINVEVTEGGASGTPIRLQARSVEIIYG